MTPQLQLPYEAYEHPSLPLLRLARRECPCSEEGFVHSPPSTTQDEAPSSVADESGVFRRVRVEPEPLEVEPHTFEPEGVQLPIGVALFTGVVLLLTGAGVGRLLALALF